MKKRRIFFLTGARSDYDLMLSVMRSVHTHPQLEAGLVVCAAQLSPFHGLNIQQIERDGLPIIGRVESLLCSETWEGRSLSFANLVQGLTHLLSQHRPDVLVVAGDREEGLAGALVANFLRFPVAHLHGGDRCCASEIDEIWRPAISKLAHYHFPATENHRQRLIKMGERADRVWTSGAPGLDLLKEEPDISNEELSSFFGVDVAQPFFLLIQHPSPNFTVAQSGEEMRTILKAVLSLGHPVFCSYPNFDPGNIAMRTVIDEMRAKHPHLIVYHNLERQKFIALYRRCTAMLGNSSSLLIEAEFLGVPGILIGPRQDMRDAGPHVIRVRIREDEIRLAAQRCLQDEKLKKALTLGQGLYGDGQSGPRISGILASLDLSPDDLLKTITY